MKLKVKCGKEKLEVEVADDGTVQDLKAVIAEKTSIPVDNQKLMMPGKPITDNAASLSAAGITAKSMLMVMGSTSEDAAASAKKAVIPTEEEIKKASAKPLCEETQHAKIINAGAPEGVENVGNEDIGQIPLPIDEGTRTPYLRDIINGAKQRCRMRVVSKDNMLVLASTEDMTKIPFHNITGIKSEPITSHEGKYRGYHILTISLGDSANSKMFLYFYPAQYVQNLKQIIFGF